MGRSVRVTSMLRHQEGTPLGAGGPLLFSLSVVRISVTSISVCLTFFICGMDIPKPSQSYLPSLVHWIVAVTCWSCPLIAEDVAGEAEAHPSARGQPGREEVQRQQ